MVTPAPHHSGKRYRRLGQLVVDTAKSNPRAVCCHCGRTLRDHRPGDTWTRGHTHAGSRTWQPWLNVEVVPPPGDWLAPAAASCNYADGARQAQRQRAEPHSERW